MYIWIYMDDIAIATKIPSLPAHVAAITDILAIACNNSLFFKLSKCTFHASSIDYMGVILENGVTCMDPVKVAGVHDWPTPKSIKDVWSFHGFCYFYCPFIAGFAKVALPLNALTKKDTKLVWNSNAHTVFNTLKANIMSKPILAHPDLTKQFKLETDTSGYAVGVVLMQSQQDNKRHP